MNICTLREFLEIETDIDEFLTRKGEDAGIDNKLYEELGFGFPVIELATFLGLHPSQVGSPQ
jgi:hypothetical protein